MKQQLVFPIVRRDPFGLLGLLFSTCALLIVIFLVIRFQILPMFNGDLELLESQQGTEFLYIAVSIVTGIWGTSLTCFFLQRSFERIKFTEEYSDGFGITGRRHRVSWKEIRHIRYDYLRGCIELRSEKDIVRVHNVFADARLAVVAILNLVPSNVVRSKSIENLKRETETGACQHPFYWKVPILSVIFYFFTRK